MVYGDSLIHFSELFVSVEYYQDTPTVGDGYDRVYLGTVDIILQPGTGEQLVGPSGRLAGRSNWRVIDSSDNESVWVPEDSPLKIGHTIKSPENGLFYKVVESSPWSFYAGFKSYKIQKIQGNNDNNLEPAGIKQGAF